MNILQILKIIPAKKNDTVDGILKKTGSDFETDDIYLAYHSSLTISEAKSMIGKKIKRVVSDKNRIAIIFETGEKLLIEGYSLDSEGRQDSLNILFDSKIDV